MIILKLLNIKSYLDQLFLKIINYIKVTIAEINIFKIHFNFC